MRYLLGICIVFFGFEFSDSIIVGAERATGWYGFFSQQDIASRDQFAKITGRFVEGCELQQAVLSDARNSIYCHDELGDSCASRAAKNEAFDAEANELIWGAVKDRKDLARVRHPSLVKTMLLGTAYATHATWRCIEDGASADYEITYEFAPTWDNT
ncbi:MAG: hypothetical protein AAB473_02380 [Patescibacteria group bacterium]